MNPIALLHLIVALAIIGISLPLVKRKIKRNPWYGIRISETFKSEERWLEINQYGGRLMVRLGVIIALTAGGSLTLPKKYWAIYGLSEVAVILIGLAIVTILIFRYAARTRKG